MTNYFVNCDCGFRLTVSSTDAGSSVLCECGEIVAVPSLSKLRTAVGESAVPRNTIESIRHMIVEGHLPADSDCPHSGRPADTVIHVLVECERPWFRGRDTDGMSGVLLALLFGWIGMLVVFGSRRREELGRETSVKVPLRVASESRPKLLRLRNQKKWRKMLCQTPVYAKLFKEFPKATITSVSAA